MAPLPLIQLDMLAVLDLQPEPSKLELLRSHRWSHGATVELPLVSIELVEHGGAWMWAANLNSANGSGYSYKPLPKWGRFAQSKAEALERAADEVRGFTHRATKAEQERIGAWLGVILSR